MRQAKETTSQCCKHSTPPLSVSKNFLATVDLNAWWHGRVAVKQSDTSFTVSEFSTWCVGVGWGCVLQSQILSLTHNTIWSVLIQCWTGDDSDQHPKCFANTQAFNSHNLKRWVSIIYWSEAQNIFHWTTADRPQNVETLDSTEVPRICYVFITACVARDSPEIAVAQERVDAPGASRSLMACLCLFWRSNQHQYKQQSPQFRHLSNLLPQRWLPLTHCSRRSRRRSNIQNYCRNICSLLFLNNSCFLTGFHEKVSQ